MKEFTLKDPDNSLIGSNIRKRREQIHVSREELARRISVTDKSLAEMEYGSRGISVGTLLRLKQALGVSAEYILEGEDQEIAEEEKRTRINNDILTTLSECTTNQLQCMEEIAQICADIIVLNK